MIKYYKNRVIFKEGFGVGIITGWKNCHKIYQSLTEENQKKVASCGQLYSVDGINYILANGYLNPQINTYILLKDSDLYKEEKADSISAFEQFLNTGVLPFTLKFCFSKEDLQKYQEYFKQHFVVLLKKDLNSFLSSFSVFPENWTEKKEIQEHTITDIKQFPSEITGFSVRAEKVKDAYERALKLIDVYGMVKPSSYDEKQKELINLSITVKNEDLHKPSIVENTKITEREIEHYVESLLKKQRAMDITYTYGNRFRDFKGTDQLEYMVNTLKQEPYSRRAVAILWDPILDTKTKEVPCLNLYQAIVQGETLHLLSYLRSNDVYDGWPKNIYGLLKIQEYLCDALHYQKGYVNTITGSAHIYERNFEEVNDFLGKHKVSFCEEEERGYFVIEVGEEIVVQLYSKAGVFLKEYRGKSASALRSLCSFHVSNMDHAMYLGEELAKAEMALKWNLPYVQDQDLTLPKVKKLEK